MITSLTCGTSITIDAEDLPLLSRYRWRAERKLHTSYVRAVALVDGKRTTLYLHRLIMGAKKGQIIDHTDRDGLNNTRANLRICTHRQNSRNKSSIRGGFKGVRWEKRRRKWHARIIVREGERKRELYLGLHENAEDAARAYDRAALKHFGEYAATNFPREQYESEAA